jgi:hypothetical protein
MELKISSAVAVILLVVAAIGNDAAVAMDDVRVRIAGVKADAERLGTCHERLHEIGREAFGRYGVAALNVSEEWCNAGYVHGVIEMALAESGDPIAAMLALCADADERSFSGW